MIYIQKCNYISFLNINNYIRVHMRAAGVLQHVTFGVSDVRIFEDLVDFIKKPLFQRLVLSGKFFELSLNSGVR